MASEIAAVSTVTGGVDEVPAARKQAEGDLASNEQKTSLNASRVDRLPVRSGELLRLIQDFLSKWIVL